MKINNRRNDYGMTFSLRKTILVLSSILLTIQFFFMTIRIYAETIKDHPEDQEQVELPKAENYLEDEQEDVPYFSFAQSQVQGIVGDPVDLNVISDLEISEITVALPKEAKLIQELLPVGLSVEQKKQAEEWLVHSKRAQTVFDLPVIFESPGEFEISVGEETVRIKINEQEEKKTDEELLTSTEDHVEYEDNSITDSEITIVGDSTDLLNAINSDSVNQIQLSSSIILTQLATIRSNKEIDLNGNELTLNNSAELRFSGNVIKNFILKNGKISGSSTTFIGDGNNGNPNGTTNQLSGLNVYLENIDAQGNNFYNAMTTNVFLDGDIVINVRNTGFRVRNFTANEGSKVSINSSGGNASGNTDQDNNRMQGVTMGNYHRNGAEKEFLVEKNAQVSIEVDAGGQYNNGIADFTELNVYGSLSVDTWGTSLRSTPSYSTVPYIYVNFLPGSNIYIRTKSTVQTGVFFTFPAILTVDSPKKFDMIYYGDGRFFWPWAGGNISGSGVRNSTLSFKNMNVAVWRNNAKGVGVPEMLDSNLTFLEITNLNSDNTGVISTDSTIFGNFNPNNYSRISNDVNMPSPNPDLPRITHGQYALFDTTTNISGIAKYEDPDNSILEDTIVANADIKFTISGREYITRTDDFGNWEIPIDISNLSLGVTGQLEITDEGLRSTLVELVLQEDPNLPVNPVDPLEPEIEVDPENRPELPEEQGRLSIDFVSKFNFGTNPISINNQTYFAQPQLLLNEEGTVEETQERPNYIQISDRRPASERNGWQLAVTQAEQFSTESGKELAGAQLRFTNQQLVTAQDGEVPSLQVTTPLTLIPGNKSTLAQAEGTEGTGTWLYRFGDASNADKSIALELPKGSTPDAAPYSTELIWELSSVPGNTID